MKKRNTSVDVVDNFDKTTTQFMRITSRNDNNFAHATDIKPDGKRSTVTFLDP